MWLGAGASGGLLRKWLRNFRSHKMWGISELTEELLTSQDEGLFSMELASEFARISKVTLFKRAKK